MILVSRNGADTLPMALEALAACETPPGGREVLLVDNGSSDETPALMRAFAQDHAARVLAEPRPGKSHGLNTAIEAARGEMLAFIDDDIVVSPGWLMAFHEAARTGDAGLLAGRIEPLWQSPPPRWLEHLAMRGQACGCTDPAAPAGPYPHEAVKGGNFAVPRQALGSLRFDTGQVNFGAQGTAAGGEDARLAAALAAQGWTIIHVPEARAGHVISAEETGFDAALRRFVRIGRSRAAFLGLGPAHVPALAAKVLVRLAAIMALAPFGPARAGEQLARLATTWGRLAGALGGGRR